MLEQDLDVYSFRLGEFRREHPEVKPLLYYPDYAGIKVATYEEFEGMVDQFKEEALDVTTYDTNRGMRLATVKMLGTLPVQGFGQIDWVVLKKPYKEDSTEVTQLRYVSFHEDDKIDDDEEILKASGLDYDRRGYESEQWINIRFAHRFGVKLSRSPMDQVSVAFAKKFGVASTWHREMNVPLSHSRKSK
jgi:hypothetical protein